MIYNSRFTYLFSGGDDGNIIRFSLEGLWDAKDFAEWNNYSHKMIYENIYTACALDLDVDQDNFYLYVSDSHRVIIKLQIEENNIFLGNFASSIKKVNIKKDNVKKDNVKSLTELIFKAPILQNLQAIKKKTI